jgi:hypothetical protein
MGAEPTGKGKAKGGCYNAAMESRPAAAKRTRTGLNALRTRVRVRGLQSIDRRTAAARALLGWRDDLIGALGGEDAVSPQQRVLVDLAVRTKLYVDAVDAWIVEQPSLVLARKRSILPVVRERQALADSLARLLGQLGLERRLKEVPTLRAYLAAKTPPALDSSKEAS